jgi:hypothetical protein
MIEWKKVRMEYDEIILCIGGIQMPLNQALKWIMVFGVITAAFTLGQLQSSANYTWMAYFSGHGIKDIAGYDICEPIALPDRTVGWECKNTATNFTDRFNSISWNITK